MIDYWQPDFYSFSQDSIEFAKCVSEQISTKSLTKVLDLGCGCGVVGIEILKQRETSIELFSLDSENSYRDYYFKNTKAFIPQHHCHFINSSFQDFKSDQQFDCIISNPPYFLNHQGRPNPDYRKDHARRWSVEDQKSFFKIFQNLAKEGTGFFLSRMNLEDWKILRDSVKLNLKITEIDQVVGAKIFNVTSFE